jgi:hypothetical protein
MWEVCAGPNRSLLAWEVSSEWLTPIYCQLRLGLTTQMGASGRGSPKYPCHHDDIGRPSGGNQPRDLLSVPTVAACRGPHPTRFKVLGDGLERPRPVRWISAITARVVALALLTCSDLAARALPIVSAPVLRQATELGFIAFLPVENGRCPVWSARIPHAVPRASRLSKRPAALC